MALGLPKARMAAKKINLCTKAIFSVGQTNVFIEQASTWALKDKLEKFFKTGCPWKCISPDIKWCPKDIRNILHYPNP